MLAKPMRILFVSGSYGAERCGVGDYTAHLAEHLATLPAVEVATLTTGDEQVSDRSERANPAVLRHIPTWSASMLSRAIREIRQWKPDIVHFQYPTQGYDGPLPYLLPAAVRLWLRLPVVETLHEIDRGGWKTPLFLLAPASAVVVVRPNYRPEGGAARAMRNKTWELIPNAATIPAATLSGEERAAIRRRITPDRRIIAYFGHIYPRRGVHQLLEVADPRRDHLVIIGAQYPGFESYYEELATAAAKKPWAGHVTLTGFLESAEAAKLIAAADAAVLPFVVGGGVWNTSLHAVVQQRIFVLTTSAEERGYLESENVFFAEPGNIEEMRAALDRYAGVKSSVPSAWTLSWDEIARRHYCLYERAVRWK